MRGVPDPEMKEKVLLLRRQGYTYREIIEETGLAKSTVSSWCSNLEMSDEASKKLKLKQDQVKRSAECKIKWEDKSRGGKKGGKKGGKIWAERLKRGEVPHPSSLVSSEARARQARNQSIRQSLNPTGGRAKYFRVSNGQDEVWVQGKWELAVANELNRRGVSWERGKFFVYDGHHRYTPDFFLPEHGFHLEVKGRLLEKDVLKMEKTLQKHDIVLKLMMVETYREFVSGSISVSDIPDFGEWAKERIGV